MLLKEFNDYYLLTDAYKIIINNKDIIYLALEYHYKIVSLVDLHRSAPKWVLIRSDLYIGLIVTGKAGTRQGCKHSQYLFNTLLAVVSTAIGQIKEMKRIQIGKEEI